MGLSSRSALAAVVASALVLAPRAASADDDRLWVEVTGYVQVERRPPTLGWFTPDMRLDDLSVRGDGPFWLLGIDLRAGRLYSSGFVFAFGGIRGGVGQGGWTFLDVRDDQGNVAGVEMRSLLRVDLLLPGIGYRSPAGLGVLVQPYGFVASAGGFVRQGFVKNGVDAWAAGAGVLGEAEACVDGSSLQYCGVLGGTLVTTSPFGLLPGGTLGFRLRAGARPATVAKPSRSD